MTTTNLFARTQLQEAFAGLRNDLIHEDGPRISTMRNYRFAIGPYAPTDEFKLRGEVPPAGLQRAHVWRQQQCRHRDINSGGVAAARRVPTTIAAASGRLRRRARCNASALAPGAAIRADITATTR